MSLRRSQVATVEIFKLSKLALIITEKALTAEYNGLLKADSNLLFYLRYISYPSGVFHYSLETGSRKRSIACDLCRENLFVGLFC